MTIVKVQKPLMSTEHDAPWLIYDRFKTVIAKTPGSQIPEDIKKWMGNDYKAYFDATLTLGNWKINKRVSPKTW